MGTYRGFKTEVIGPVYEQERIKAAIVLDKDLALSLDKWDGHIKNWTPDEKLQEISKQCKSSYILLTTTEEATETHQTVYYKGVGMNAMHPTLRRVPTISAVRKQRPKIK